MTRLFAFEINSLPTELDQRSFIESMLNCQFMLCHFLKGRKTFLITEGMGAGERLERAVPGISLYEEALPTIALNAPHYAVGYAPLRVNRDGKIEEIFGELYRVLGGTDAFLIVSFVPAPADHVTRVRTRIEELSSRKSIRLTKNMGNRNGLSATSDSMQMELFYDSDERKMLLSLLDSLNEASMKNGTAYGICLIADSKAIEYLKTKLFIFEDRRIMADSIESVYRFCKKSESLPFSHVNAAAFLSFSDRIRRYEPIKTTNGNTSGEIRLGEYLHGSLTESGEPICLDYRTLNLGTVISGLPGTGKTATAMSILTQAHVACKAHLIVLSPTDEWNQVGKSIGMRTVRLYGDSTRINFFRCDSGINIEKFYENLAMLMAHASNAGPYTNSMEKSLLSAFRKVYAHTRAPDPAVIYGEIENAVIEQHGKRSNVGVRYTKHGENVTAALQCLRLMLLKPQFAYTEGENFSELIGSGVVFDLSQVSNNMKPFFYALILNQLYSFTDVLDTNGNDELRLLICIEEAQLILDQDEGSAAAKDLEQRIQDFRKKGIGLVLIAHSVTDIGQEIRRLCQTKLYFRQSADVAKHASNDLIFSDEESRVVMDRLKSMQQGRCVMSYVTIEKGLRVVNGSVFVKVQSFEMQKEPQPESRVTEPANKSVTRIKVMDHEGKPMADTALRITYVGETVFSGKTDYEGMAVVENLMKDRRYKLSILGEKKRDTKIFAITGSMDTEITIDAFRK